MARRRLQLFLRLILAGALALAGCARSDGDGSANEPPPSDQSPEDDDTEDRGEVAAVEEFVVLDAPPAPPNPVTGAPTLPEQNVIGFIRLRADTGDDPSRPVRAILVLFAGHTIDGGEFRHLGRELVRLSDGQIEVWAQVRRSHFLADNWGVEWAEVRRDPEVAWGYYVEGLPVEGRAFGGFLDPRGPETEMQSEWGLDVEMADIARILSLIPPEVRSQVVFVGGHSRGVAFAEAFAAYRFPDGHRGTEEIAGLVLIDGAAPGGGPETAEEYRAALDLLRRGERDRFTAIPLERVAINLPLSQLGAPLYVLLQIAGMAGSEAFVSPEHPELGPDAVWPRETFLHDLLWLQNGRRRITVTNEALFGLLIDDETGMVPLLTGQVGRPTGGAMEERGGRLILTDENALYSWLRADEVEPEEIADLRLLFRALWEGPSNTMDPYYPTRVDLDLQVAGYGRFETTGTWRDEFFQMRTSEVDAPVYAVAAAMILGTRRYQGEYEAYRDLLAPVRGSNRPRTEAGFRVLEFPDWGHLDPVMLRPGNVFYPDLAAWLLENSRGEVQVPRM